jgi:hypothetical protein
MLKRLALIVALLAFAAPAPARAAGLIGSDLAEARKTSDFFTFFHLTPTAPADAHGVTAFRPSGPEFRDLVLVTATTDKQGRITAMTLMIRRSFIDDPVNGVFARDIAKSFLGDAPSPADAALLKPLIDAIQSGTRDLVSPEYAIFVGGFDASIDHPLAGEDLRVAPTTDDGQAAVLFSIETR